MKTPENIPSPEGQLPELLDIVKIDGKWAQVKSGGGETSLVLFLEDNQGADINWSEYQLTRTFNSLPVGTVEQVFGEKFSEEELDNVRWGPEQEQTPALKKQVRVFGEFVKKEQSEESSE